MSPSSGDSSPPPCPPAWFTCPSRTHPDAHLWLATPNFFAITHYNRSYVYAGSVLSLAAALENPGSHRCLVVELALLPESPDIIHRHAGKGLDLTVLIRRREVQGRLQSIAHHLLTLQAWRPSAPKTRCTKTEPSTRRPDNSASDKPASSQHSRLSAC